MPETVRKLVKWPTKRRKGGSRVWKKKWVTKVKAEPKPGAKTEAKPEKKAG